MNDDVVLAKMTTIQRCLRRVKTVYAGDPARLEAYDSQDSIVLNLQRACEATIDLAMHVIAVRKLGVPNDAKDAFTMLQREGLLSADLAARMGRMVGFRNIAVHDYTALDLGILRSIVEHGADDLAAFADAVLKM